MMTSAKGSDLRPLSPESDRIMLRLLLETGLPLDDLRGVKVSDLDRDRGLLRLERGGVSVGRRDGNRVGGEPEVEEIPLPLELLAAVEDYVDKNPGKTYIFEGRCGRPVGPKWVRCTLLPAAIRSGLVDPRAGTDRK